MRSTGVRLPRWWAPRWLTGLLAVVLTVLSGYATVGNWRQSVIVHDVAASSADTDAYQQAAYLAAWEMALIQAALRDPDTRRRQQLLAVDQQAQDAMVWMATVDREHSSRSAYLAQRHLNMRPEIVYYLRCLDRGDGAAAQHSVDAVLEPAATMIMDGLLEEQRHHLAEYTRNVATARHDSRGLLDGSILIFGLGLATLVLLGWAARSYRRQVRATAATDALTGLPNRSAFTAYAQRALSASRRGGKQSSVTVLAVNVDGFRAVNERLGTAVGDRLLTAVGCRLTASVRRPDVVARLGGDEFAVLLLDDDPRIGETIAARLADAFDQPFLIDELTIDVAVSLGAATAEPGDEVTGLLRHADTAMHTAKHRNIGFSRYTREDERDSAASLVLLGDLRRGLDDPAQFRLHYQPKVTVDGGALAGVEALARWQHPEKGMIPPDQFIPVLEATTLIHRFTDRVLTLALHQARAWLDGGHPTPVAVNLSTRSLLDPGFPDRLAALLGQADVPGPLLCIEITEHTVMSDPATAIDALCRIRGLGVKVSIDDYGTGYSSMTYLRVLPVDELKIDRSFVQDMVTDPVSHALVASTIALGHHLGLTVVAEGVEDADTHTALRALGCDTAQGYHHARPQPADTLSDTFGLHPARAAAHQPAPR